MAYREKMLMLWVAMSLVVIAGCNSTGSSEEGESASARAGEDSTGNETTTASASEKTTVQPMMSDYAPIPLDRLIGTAQLIVAGEVLAVKDQAITVRVNQTLAGEGQSPEIEVLQYVPSRFEGAPRAAPYQTGQSFLWFLFKGEKPQTAKIWKILGAGGEGEMPVQDGFVFFHGRQVEGIPLQSYRVHGEERNIQRVEAPVFFDAVKTYRSCFAWKPGNGERPRPIQSCDDATLNRYARTSDIHRYLAQLGIKRQQAE